MQPENPKSGASIELNTFIRTSPERVFEILTTAAGWDAWLTEGTMLDARPGGEILLRWGKAGTDGCVTRAVVIEVTPPTRFRFSWHPADLDTATTVSFEIEPAADGIILSVHEEGYPETGEGITAMVTWTEVWGKSLTLIKMYLES